MSAAIPAVIPASVLLPYQQAWIADPATVKMAEKSRRTGITWAEAADASLTAGAEKKAGGRHHFYIGTNKEMAREFIDAAAMWARAFNKAATEVQEEIFSDDSGDKDILTFVIHFPHSGFKIQALSSRPNNLRGMQGNVTIDEAAFHDALAEVLKAALALTMWGAKVRLISTHNGVDNLFNELLLDCKAGKRQYSLHHIDLNEACEQGLYQRICEVTGEQWNLAKQNAWQQQLIDDCPTTEDAEEEYFCIPKQGGGVYLSRTLLEARADAAPVIRYTGSDEFNQANEHQRKSDITQWCDAVLLPLLKTLDQNEQHSFGEDFARSGDLTVMCPMAIAQNLQRRVPFLVELKNVPFRQQEQILDYICDRLPRFIAAKLDARGNGQYLAEQAKYRYGSGRVEEVQLTLKWYGEHMPKMKQALEDDELRIVKDRDVIDDLRAIQVIKGVPKLPDGNTSQNKKQQRHGDAAVAICMAYAASLSDVVIYDYEAVTRPSTDDDSDDYRDIQCTHGFGARCGGIL